MTRFRPAGPFLLLLVSTLPLQRCAGVTLRIDYSQDSSGFFSNSSTQGRQARAVLDSAASFYSNLLEDSLSPVSVPGRFYGVGGGTANFYLQFADPNFPHDSSRAVSLGSYPIAQDEYIVFVGGAPLGGSQLASAGLGGSSYDYQLFVEEDIPKVEQIYANFVAGYETRGQSSGFAHWGGTISFDNDGGVNWSYTVGTPPGPGQTDLYSVALHELGHVLGFGSTTLQEEGLVDGANRFSGAAAVAEYGGPVPLSPGRGHWAEQTMSTVLGTGAAQEALYDPSFNGSVRKDLTALDAAGLADLGWSIALPQSIAGDFNGDGLVDSADYTVWRDGIGSRFTASDYDTWRQHYSEGGAASPVNFTAPAPSASLILLSLTALLAGARASGAFALRR